MFERDDIGPRAEWRSGLRTGQRPRQRSGQRIGRRQLLLTAAFAGGHVLLAGCGGRRVERLLATTDAPSAGRAALLRGARWLWEQQSDDGRFESRTYGLLRSGQSLTPFALLPLLRVPEVVPQGAAQRAADAMRDMQSPSGALGFATSVADYPCYASGLMASCLGILKEPNLVPSHSRLASWLRGQQFRTADGWNGHPAQGGWGMGDRVPRKPPEAGHVDLSMTRRVIEGLRSLGVPVTDPALLEARHFVRRCQTEDGSFLYSPVELALNKGHRTESGAPRGYGSATCDGFLSLHALGIGDREPAKRALDWLREHHRVDANPGVLGGPMEAFAEAMRGYYRAASAACFAIGGGPASWRAELVDAICTDQKHDGSWQNENPLQKENDPIISTSLALTALLGAV